MENSGLTKDDIFNIRSVFSNYPQIEEALIYGSRAMGNYRPASDIDISLIGDDIDLSLLNQIEFDLDDIMLPYKFDVSIYHKIHNPELLDHINRVGKNLYQRRMNTDFISN
ncbi:Predicted nucleotidyltransferase [Marivirga sericea]|uniref:Predicted nucleotidyltransferase n=1 Tax=Marivirga sericea TaxID=1028 RepID=A0A1X7K2S0_9BACT|nr:nucleotidyltransferase domain-containing protein [Marivirga sericea]SMG35197.1 Predicted nucleotidyltransferase [Marivirga sericea]